MKEARLLSIQMLAETIKISGEMTHLPWITWREMDENEVTTPGGEYSIYWQRGLSSLSRGIFKVIREE